MPKRGDVYIDADFKNPYVRRIIILGEHPLLDSTWVGTYDEVTGKVSRQRWILDSQLHDTPLTKSGTRRATGYFLDE